MPLVSAPHLARSYHHLFPPPNTIPHIPDDIPEDERDQTERELFNLIQPCIGCGDTANSIEEGKQFVYCELCRSSLCQDWIRTIMICIVHHFLRVVQVRIHSTFEINVGSDSLRFSPTLNLDSH